MNIFISHASKHFVAFALSYKTTVNAVSALAGLHSSSKHHSLFTPQIAALLTYAHAPSPITERPNHVRILQASDDVERLLRQEPLLCYRR
jgi:hypothetical protein